MLAKEKYIEIVLTIFNSIIFNIAALFLSAIACTAALSSIIAYKARVISSLGHVSS